jgi:hypothetical protein
MLGIDFSKLLGGANTWLSDPNNKDKFSIMAGQLGASLGGDGSWQQGAGNLASTLGQSSIANRAYKDQKEQNTQLLSQLMGGQTVDPTAKALASIPAPANVKQSSQGFNLEDINLTPADQNGPTSFTVKTGANGEKIVTTNHTMGSKLGASKTSSLGDLFGLNP